MTFVLVHLIYVIIIKINMLQYKIVVLLTIRNAFIVYNRCKIIVQAHIVSGIVYVITNPNMPNLNADDPIDDEEIESFLDSIKPHVSDFTYIKSCFEENSETYYKFLKFYLRYNNCEFWDDFVITHLKTNPVDILDAWNWTELSLDQYLAIQLHPLQIPDFINENNRVFVEYWTILDDEKHDRFCTKCISYMLGAQQQTVQKYTESISCAADKILSDIIRKTKYWCCNCTYCALFNIYDTDEDWSRFENLSPQNYHNAIY